MSEQKKKGKRQRASQRSKGLRSSSMKTAGFHDRFINVREKIGTGWTAKERERAYKFIVNWVKEQNETETESLV